MSSSLNHSGFIQGDCLEVLATLPAGCADLVFGSPPYEQARLYLEDGSDLGIARDTEAWVAWMVDVFKASLRVCRGLVAFVVAGQTRAYRWSAGPALLMADLHRAGIHLRTPPIFHRVGIPGSGGPDWLRNDCEFIVCATNGGKLPWSDNTACGHVPKWAPGGEMSNRLTDGSRVNQWGHSLESGATVVAADGVVRSKGKRPSHKEPGGRGRNKDGTPKKRKTFGHNGDGSVKGAHERDIVQRHTRGKGRNPDGTMGSRPNPYEEPVLANPGNSIERSYTAAEVADQLVLEGDWMHHNVGGGVMGENPILHSNEAPFPETLAAFFIQSFCQPGGLCIDPFSGSGTTVAVATRHLRRGLGIDLRASQVEIGRQRLASETPMALFGG